MNDFESESPPLYILLTKHGNLRIDFRSNHIRTYRSRKQAERNKFNGDIVVELNEELLKVSLGLD